MSEAETENEVQTPTSSEDKFFGVKTQHSKLAEPAPEEAEQSGFEVEVVDDTPPEEKKPVKRTKELAEPHVKFDDGFTDEELKTYSKGVQKRINQLRAINHSDRRKVGEAQRMRDEAVRVAQSQQKKIQEYESLLANSQGAIIESTKGKAQAELDSAEKELKKAHEEGDADKLVQSQKALAAATAKINEMEQREQKYRQAQQAQKRKQEELAKQPQQPQPQPQQRVQVSPQQEKWNSENPWFQPNPVNGQIDPLHKEMTAVGLAIHDNLYHEGITAAGDPQRYYAEVDRRMRQRFPDYSGFAPTEQAEEVEEVQEERSAPQRQRSNTTVVAPSTSRNNGAKTRKVQLSKTQTALARRLGITNEAYAEQLLKQEIG